MGSHVPRRGSVPFRSPSELRALFELFALLFELCGFASGLCGFFR